MNPESYEPQPIDTSEIRLPRKVDQTIEKLTRNNHEVWAKERRELGWRYGPNRDDANKEHPDLVPYDDLSEDEKQFDRKTVEQTLKATLKLGFKIKFAPEPVKIPDRPAAENPGDDMEVWPPLPAAFNAPKTELIRIYQRSDGRAKWRLRAHRWIVLVAAVCGSLAVIAAIGELYGRATSDPSTSSTMSTVAGQPAKPAAGTSSSLGGEVFEGGEFLVAALAFGAVVLGLSCHLKRTWLLERHRAELCRFAKYRVLLRLAAAGGGHEASGRCLEDFKDQITTIDELDRDDLEQFIEEDPVPEGPPEVKHGSSKFLPELGTHYVKQRLNHQAKYFLTQSREKSTTDARSRWFPPALFFGSIFFAFLHFAFSSRTRTLFAALPLAFFRNALNFFLRLAPSVYLFIEKIVGVVRANSLLWIVLAAALPVVGAGIRLWRSAFEFSRNTARFRAKYRALEQLILKLETELNSQHAIAPEEVVCDIWRGEMILQEEHREWLRLMKEAEWFG